MWRSCEGLMTWWDEVPRETDTKIGLFDFSDSTIGRRRDTEGETQEERHRRRDTEGETQEERHRRKDTGGETQEERHRRRDTEGETQKHVGRRGMECGEDASD